jgi:hypothetical protein
MGGKPKTFRVAKTFKAHGWIPKKERSIDAICKGAGAGEENPAADLVFSGEQEEEGPMRRVKVTVTITVEGV